jgi:hypothetical protein
MNGASEPRQEDDSAGRSGPPPLPSPPYFSSPLVTPPSLPPPIPPWPSRSGPSHYVLNPNSRTRDDSSWAGTIIICCLAIGFLGAMIQFERARYGSELNRAYQLATSVELAQADQETLGRNLSDPNTVLVHLSGFAATDGHASALAFNLPLRWGALLCDRLTKLPDGQHYEVWAILNGSPDNAALIAVLDSEPGVSVYPFHFQSDIVSADRIEITAGPRSAAAPVLNGEIAH